MNLPKQTRRNRCCIPIIVVVFLVICAVGGGVYAHFSIQKSKPKLTPLVNVQKWNDTQNRQTIKVVTAPKIQQTLNISRPLDSGSHEVTRSKPLQAHAPELIPQNISVIQPNDTVSNIFNATATPGNSTPSTVLESVIPKVMAPVANLTRLNNTNATMKDIGLAGSSDSVPLPDLVRPKANETDLDSTVHIPDPVKRSSILSWRNAKISAAVVLTVGGAAYLVAKKSDDGAGPGAVSPNASPRLPPAAGSGAVPDHAETASDNQKIIDPLEKDSVASPTTNDSPHPNDQDSAASTMPDSTSTEDPARISNDPIEPQFLPPAETSTTQEPITASLPEQAPETNNDPPVKITPLIPPTTASSCPVSQAPQPPERSTSFRPEFVPGAFPEELELPEVPPAPSLPLEKPVWVKDERAEHEPPVPGEWPLR